MTNCRLSIITLIFVTILSTFVARGQQTQGGSNVMVSLEWVTGEREELPSWVLQSHKDGRYVGISDPCVDPSYAHMQAVLRALFISAMVSPFEINILNETYETFKTIGVADVSSSRFTQFVRFSTKRGATPTKYFRVDRSYVSTYGEHFVELVECSAAKSDVDDSSLHVSGEFVFYGSESSVVRGKIRSELTIKAKFNSEIHEISYIASGGRESRTLTRSIDGRIVTNFESGRFWYSDVDGGVKAPDNGEFVNHYPLVDGVWSSLYQSMISTIVNNPNYPYVVKSVDQQAGGSHGQQLVRSLYKGRDVSATLLGYRILSDSLEAQWKMQFVSVQGNN